MTKKKEKRCEGEGEENVYGEQAREDLIDSDEISAEEEGFMAGYDEAAEDSEEESDEESEDKDKNKDKDKDKEPQ